MKTPAPLAQRLAALAFGGLPLLAVSLIAGLLALDALTSTARSADFDPHVTVNATLLDGKGVPLDQIGVELGALLPDHGLTLSHPLASTTTGVDGSFALTADPSSLPRDADGYVRLEVATVGTQASDSFVYDVRAMPPATGKAWLLELPPVSAPANAETSTALRGTSTAARLRQLTKSVEQADTQLVLQQGAGLIADSTTTSVPGLRVRHRGSASPFDAPEPGERLVAPPGEDGAGREETDLGTGRTFVDPFFGAEHAAVSHAQTSCTPGDTAAWANMDSYKWTWVPTKFGKTLSQATFRWKIAQSQETDLQASITIAGSHSAGGFMGSAHEDSTLTVEPVIGYQQRKIFYMKWKFRHQQRICVRTNPAGGFYKIHSFRWVPDSPTGGNIQLGTDATFACGGPGPRYHDLFSAKTTVSRSTSVTFDGFFQVGGLRLDAKQGDGQAQEFTIQPRAGAVADACGSNDRPVSAALAKES